MDEKELLRKLAIQFNESVDEEERKELLSKMLELKSYLGLSHEDFTSFLYKLKYDRQLDDSYKLELVKNSDMVMKVMITKQGEVNE